MENKMPQTMENSLPQLWKIKCPFLWKTTCRLHQNDPGMFFHAVKPKIYAAVPPVYSSVKIVDIHYHSRSIYQLSVI